MTRVELLLYLIGYRLSLEVQNENPHRQFNRHGFSWLKTTSLKAEVPSSFQ